MLQTSDPTEVLCIEPGMASVFESESREHQQKLRKLQKQLCQYDFWNILKPLKVSPEIIGLLQKVCVNFANIIRSYKH